MKGSNDCGCQPNPCFEEPRDSDTGGGESDTGPDCEELRTLTSADCACCNPPSRMEGVPSTDSFWTVGKDLVDDMQACGIDVFTALEEDALSECYGVNNGDCGEYADCPEESASIADESTHILWVDSTQSSLQATLSGSSPQTTSLTGGGSIDDASNTFMSGLVWNTDPVSIGPESFDDWYLFFDAPFVYTPGTGVGFSVPASGLPGIAGHGNVNGIPHYGTLSPETAVSGTLNFTTMTWTLDASDSSIGGVVTLHLAGTIEAR